MREIKFRAWDADDKVMVSPDYISRDGRACWKSNSIPTSSIYVMQFTGLKDKNGTEIYEGDILVNQNGYQFEIQWAIPGETYVGWVVKWLNHPTPPLAYDLLFGNVTRTCEVIGNIYDEDTPSV